MGQFPMAGKFSRKKQEPGASWVLGAVLIALLLAAITLGALWVLRASKACRHVRRMRVSQDAHRTVRRAGNCDAAAASAGSPSAGPQIRSLTRFLPSRSQNPNRSLRA